MHNYRQLKVWQRSLAFALRVYREAAEHFPADERFGLTSQIRRAASSIPMNIAPKGRAIARTKSFADIWRWRSDPDMKS